MSVKSLLPLMGERRSCVGRALTFNHRIIPSCMEATRHDSCVFCASRVSLLYASSYLSFSDLHNDAGLYSENDSPVYVVWFRGAFSLTKTATGILFKFSNIDDYQAVYKKGFHKVTGARFYKKVRYKEKKRGKRKISWNNPNRVKQTQFQSCLRRTNCLAFLSAKFSCSHNFLFV